MSLLAPVMSKNKKNLKQIFHFFSFALFSIFLILPVNGGIVFSDLDLAEPADSAGSANPVDRGGDNLLLFRADTRGEARARPEVVPGQDALFITRIPAAIPAKSSSAGFPAGFPVQQLTAFPETMDLPENGRVLQIRNAFGALRVPLSGGLPMPIPGLPSFAGGSSAVSGGAAEMASSADGRWLLYLTPESPALGNLVMADALTGEKTQVASRLERPETLFPASWSPDSRFFIYEREGKLYYYTAGFSDPPLNEKTRLVGDGTISSISWSRGGDFYYLRGSTLYRVRGAELFTRALYADFLEIGTVVGKIPFEFDPCFDSFWIAPDGRSLLISKGRRSLFYYPLNTDDEASGSALPYLLLPRSCSGINVLWSLQGTVTVLVSIPNHGGTDVKAWRLELPEGKRGVFESLPPPDGETKTGSFVSGSLSPDGQLSLFWGPGGIALYDYVNWKFLEVISARPGMACLWAGNDECIIGDDQKIERIWLSRTPQAVVRREIICLSRTDQAGFEENTYRILAKSGDAWFVTDGRSPWTPIDNPRLRSPSQISGQYRVYIEREASGPYANLPMIRNIASVGTFPLFPSPENTGVSYSGLKEVALCFDLYDDDQGLPETLDALNHYGIRATFFLNGEFIRRHPLAVQDIAAAGHEIASMFFAPIDLSDSRYRWGADFVSRGLARNEDEFYRVTGKELALLWHPPWYMTSPDIIAAATRAGYTSSGRDIDPMDWVSREDEKRLGLSQRSPSEMIDSIMEAVKPGFIIPVRLGLLPGGRNNYLFNRINVLIDAFVRDGYTLTTVSTLIGIGAQRK